ncbi:tRNA-dihydrouridine16/17 synthase NADP+-like, partial [Hondaea fermentalgiana]
RSLSHSDVDKIQDQLLGLPTKQLILAPMVDASELAFRALCRRYGTKLCWSPMLHARIFCENELYRAEKFTTDEGDRPLVVQFCGHDKDILLQAAKLVEGQCDCIDLNLGCPQDIARRGRYGAFLMEEVELLEEIVSHLSANLTVPVSCKIRIFPEEARTLDLARRLEASGCSLLTVHGRTKEQNKEDRGDSDWAVIRKVKETLRIPVLANGSIGRRKDIQACLEATGADGVMSAEGLLENPALGLAPEERMPEPVQLAKEYLELAEKYGEGTKIVRGHLFKILHGTFEVHKDLREAFASQGATEGWLEFYKKLVDQIETLHSGADACKEIRCRTQQDGYGPAYDRHTRRNADLFHKDSRTGEVVARGVSNGIRREVALERMLRRLRRRQGKLTSEIGWMRRKCQHGGLSQEVLDTREKEINELCASLASTIKALERLNPDAEDIEARIAEVTDAYEKRAFQDLETRGLLPKKKSGAATSQHKGDPTAPSAKRTSSGSTQAEKGLTNDVDTAKRPRTEEQA